MDKGAALLFYWFMRFVIEELGIWYKKYANTLLPYNMSLLKVLLHMSDDEICMYFTWEFARFVPMGLMTYAYTLVKTVAVKYSIFLLSVLWGHNNHPQALKNGRHTVHHSCHCGNKKHQDASKSWGQFPYFVQIALLETTHHLYVKCLINKILSRYFTENQNPTPKQARVANKISPLTGRSLLQDQENVAVRKARQKEVYI